MVKQACKVLRDIISTKRSITPIILEGVIVLFHFEHFMKKVVAQLLLNILNGIS
jgi:hypothetical protein